jgi:tetratricopeptide (TPR) repeat protein
MSENSGEIAASRKHSDLNEAIHQDQVINGTLDRLEFPETGVSLLQFDRFVEACGGPEALSGCSTEDVCQRFLKPLTLDKRESYCDALRSRGEEGVGIANVFCSHAWRYKFLDVVDALKYHFRGNEHDIIVWFDLFSNNQHIGPTLDFSWWTTTFKSAIASFKRTVLILAPWENPIPLTRAWCLYEIFCTIETQSTFEIAMCEAEESSFIRTIVKDFDSISQMMATVDARKSTAWNIADKERIFEVVSSTVGFDAVNSSVFRLLRDWLISTVRSRIGRGSSPDGADANGDSTAAADLKVALAKIYRDQGLFADAEPLLLSAIESARSGPLLSSSSEPAPRLVELMEEHAMLLYQQGKYEEARGAFNDCLEIRLNQFKAKPTDPAVAKCMTFIGNSFQNLKKPAEAQMWFEKVLSNVEGNMEEIKGDSEGKYETLHICANLYHSRADNASSSAAAEQLYRECLALRQASLGAEHPLTIRTLNDLAAFLMRKKEYAAAQELIRECVRVRTVKLGLYNTDTLLSMNNLAVTEMALHNREAAHALFKECVAAGTAVLGESHLLVKEWTKGMSSTDASLERQQQEMSSGDVDSSSSSSAWHWEDLDLSTVNVLSNSGKEFSRDESNGTIVCRVRATEAARQAHALTSSDVVVRLYLSNSYYLSAIQRMCNEAIELTEKIGTQTIVPIIGMLPGNDQIPDELFQRLTAFVDRRSDLLAAVVAPYYSEGSIYNIFLANEIEPTIVLDWRSKLEILLSFAKCLKRLGDAELTHGRAFPWNVLFDGKNRVVLSDATWVSPLELETTMAHTVSFSSVSIQRVALYSSPKYRFEEKSTPAPPSADLYSFGVICIGIICDSDPAREMFNQHSKGGGNMMKLYSYEPKLSVLPASCPKVLVDMIDACLKCKATINGVIDVLQGCLADQPPP